MTCQVNVPVFVLEAAPGVPTNLRCYPVLHGYICYWDAPTDDGGYRITGYKVGHMEGLNMPQDSIMTVHLPASITWYTDNTRKGGDSYTVVISAVNILGSSQSVSAHVTTLSGMCLPSVDNCGTINCVVLSDFVGPYIDANVVVKTLSTFSLQATWDPPASNQSGVYAVTGYEISLYGTPFSPAIKTAHVKVDGEERVTTFDGLKDNTTYWIRVATRNAAAVEFCDFVEGRTLANGTEGLK